MKVVLLTRYASMSHAGLGRIYLNLKQGLETRGHEVITVSSDDHSPLGYLEYSFCSIRNKIPKDADIYHAITAMECRYLPPERTVVTIADMIPWVSPLKSGSGLNNNPINRWVGTAAYRSAYYQAAKCARIAVISEQGKEEVMKYLHVPEERVRLIRLGIPETLEPEPKPDNVFRVGYLGQLDRRKRVDLLITVFKESRVNGELMIAGTGADEDKLKSLAGDDKRIKFLGFVPDSRLKEFYNSLDLFAFPTAIEGYGLPIVEAMACKKEVLLAPDAIIPEELRKRCHFMASNVFELLQKYSNLPSKRVHEEENYEFARLHNWNTTVDEYEKLYYEVLND